jgi:GxxExxY protein
MLLSVQYECDILENRISYRIIGAGIEVHRRLGPGLLEKTYAACLEYELAAVGLKVASEVRIPLIYKDLHVDCAYRADLIVDDKVLIEIKSVAAIQPIHKVQVLTYLRLTSLKLGLLMNFNTACLRDGVDRVVNGLG